MNILIIAKAHRDSFREKLSMFLVNSFKPLYFLMRRKRTAWVMTLEGLDQMPAGTLGSDTAIFLRQNNLQLMPRAEFHDVYHVLFGYTTSMQDETCLQFVPLGNGKRSLPYLVSTLVSAVFYPEYWNDYYAAYQRGKNANTFHHWNLEKLLWLPTVEVKNMMFDKKGQRK